MHVQVWGRCLCVNFLSSWRATFYYVSSNNWWGGIDEIEKSCIRHVRCGHRRCFCDRLRRAPRSCEKEEGGSRGSAPAATGRMRRRTCSGLRNQRRPEVHVPQCLLGGQRRREQSKAGGGQGGQGGQGGRRRQEGKEEEESVIQNSV